MGRGFWIPEWQIPLLCVQLNVGGTCWLWRVAEASCDSERVDNDTVDERSFWQMGCAFREKLFCLNIQNREFWASSYVWEDAFGFVIDLWKHELTWQGTALWDIIRSKKPSSSLPFCLLLPHIVIPVPPLTSCRLQHFGPHLLADLFTKMGEDTPALHKSLNIFLLFHERCQLTEGSGKLRRSSRGLRCWKWLSYEGRSKMREGGNMSGLRASLPAQQGCRGPEPSLCQSEE